MKIGKIFKLGWAAALCTGPVSAFSDSAKVLEAFDARTRAYDTYYQEVKKLDQGTPEQLEQLRKKILVSAQENLNKSIETQRATERKALQELTQREFKKQEDQTARKLDQMVEKFGKTEGEREKIRAKLRDALKDKNKKGPATVAPSLKPAQKAEITSPEAPPPEPVALDGSNIPKEIVFPKRGASPTLVDF